MVKTYFYIKHPNILQILQKKKIKNLNSCSVHDKKPVTSGEKISAKMFPFYINLKAGRYMHRYMPGAV